MTDICLVLEGTYPYKTGGVSAWVDALVSGMEDVTFSIAHLYYGEKPTAPRYRVPKNVREVADISLNARAGDSPLTIGLGTLLEQVPRARLYHPLSTGFAGYLGTALKKSRCAPMLLTEHGLYWREAELGVGELECGFKIIETESGTLSLGRTWKSWSETFRSLALDAYASADAITTVCAYNRREQVRLGAPASKTRVIPNGVPLPPRERMRAPQASARPHVALVGRVAPLKDIKTFIRACGASRRLMPNAVWSVIGPTGHDDAYYETCLDLVRSLELDNFSFAGEKDVHREYPSIDCAVLTSASEAQPLALLEAMSYGIPVTATDVGGVSEIVAPADADAAGLLCPVADPEACAHGVASLLTDAGLYARCSAAGRAIVERTHSLEAMICAYRELYHHLSS
jgi:polysaccharide biosynthesis protein PelF